jgi:hypothetical protein
MSLHYRGIERMQLSPPLAWFGGFIRSIEGAIGMTVQWHLSRTVNPLVFKIRIYFPERVSGRNLMLIWNLFQMYAARNNCVPQGRSSNSDKALSAEIITKQRLGLPQNEHPLE